MPLSKESFFCVLLAGCTAASRRGRQTSSKSPSASPRSRESPSTASPTGSPCSSFPIQTKQTITVNVTYLVGSRNESYGETGMAHLLEHLMFKGTPKHTNVPQELTSHGARPNGTAWYQRTNYFETFQANDENLRWALDLEADRMIHSFIAKKDLDSEMTVVRNEFETGENDPVAVLVQQESRPPSSGTTTGTRRSGTARTSRTCRSSASRPSGGPIPPRQRHPARRRQVRRGEALAMINATFSSISRPSRTLRAT